MKARILLLCTLLLWPASGHPQGLVKFANSATTLFSLDGLAAPPGAGPFYFALLSAPLGTTDPHQFTFAGVYATNTTATTGGRFQGGSLFGVQCNSTWPAATSRSFYVFGWDAGWDGVTFDISWISTPGPLDIAHGGFWGPPSNRFGVSAIAAGMSGGTDPVTQQSLPALALFTGSTISQGIDIITWGPEPSSISLVLLGGGVIFIRNQKHRRNPRL